MTERKRQWLIRMAVGGAAGVAAQLVFGYLMGGTVQFTRFVFTLSNWQPEWLPVLCSFALFAIFGGAVAVATLPFADGGGALVRRSLTHFGVMAVTLGLWVLLNFTARELLNFLIPLALLYLLVWLARWIGWWMEVCQLRAWLGLAPGPSLFHWRETLPYLGFALLLCVVFPVVFHLLDPVDVPVLSGLLLPYLLLPVGGVCAGVSLGKRQGVCPLFPVACGLLYLPMVYILQYGTELFHCVIVFCAALAGNVAGALWRRKRGGAA